ncbi:MAG: two component transcriptional regulator, LuxR family [Firmicutes bacterium]|nr:two component transcriptional regulator, LuxR family [Bacillota bacterium]
MPIRIMIADDHALLRQGIRNVLELEDNFQVIGEAGDGEEVVENIVTLMPDILLLDINMPKMNGLDVIKRVSEQRTKIKIIVLTMHDDENYVIEVVKAGAVGYLLKDIDPGMLVKAIRTVYEGESFIYPSLAKKLFGEINRQHIRNLEASKMVERSKDERLSYREIEVLEMVCKGMSNQEVAKELFLSEKTVKNHLTNIFRKIGVTDRTQAVLYAIKNKLVAIN